MEDLEVMVVYLGDSGRSGSSNGGYNSSGGGESQFLEKWRQVFGKGNSGSQRQVRIRPRHPDVLPPTFSPLSPRFDTVWRDVQGSGLEKRAGMLPVEAINNLVCNDDGGRDEEDGKVVEAVAEKGIGLKDEGWGGGISGIRSRFSKRGATVR